MDDEEFFNGPPLEPSGGNPGLDDQDHSPGDADDQSHQPKNDGKFEASPNPANGESQLGGPQESQMVDYEVTLSSQIEIPEGIPAKRMRLAKCDEHEDEETKA